MSESLDEYLGVPGRPVHVVERSDTPSPLLTRMEAAASWLTVLRAPPSGSRPRVTISGSRTEGEVVFQGTIEGRVAEALAVFLRERATGQSDFDTPATPQLLGALNEKAFVGVHASATCAFCPAVMAAALRFAQASGWINVAIFRADEDPNPKYRSVPTVVVNGEVISEGSVGEYELAERLVERLNAG